MTTTRRLAAVLAADVAGYSRLIGANERGTLQAFKAIQVELFDPTIAANNGRLVKTTGEGILVEFGSVVDGLRCAAEVRAGMADYSATVERFTHGASERLCGQVVQRLAHSRYGRSSLATGALDFNKGKRLGGGQCRL